VGDCRLQSLSGAKNEEEREEKDDSIPFLDIGSPWYEAAPMPEIYLISV